jgi:hypothetical protein
MRRVLLFGALVGLVLSGLAYAAQQGFTLTGRVGATDQEAQEGYFAIDNQTMIVVKPGSDLHNYMRARVGQRVRVTIEPQAGSN